jgi:hypothetical protein
MSRITAVTNNVWPGVANGKRKMPALCNHQRCKRGLFALAAKAAHLHLSNVKAKREPKGGREREATSATHTHTLGARVQSHGYRCTATQSELRSALKVLLKETRHSGQWRARALDVEDADQTIAPGQSKFLNLDRVAVHLLCFWVSFLCLALLRTYRQSRSTNTLLKRHACDSISHETNPKSL